MGTNFYTAERQHLGKLSAAGLYCHKDNATLCIGGEAAIHTGKSEWYTGCHICGAVYNERDDSPVDFTCSFTWAVRPEETNLDQIVYSEYGSAEGTLREVLNSCKIRFYDAIGRDFS